MTSKPQPDQWYATIVDRHTPKKKIVRNCCFAFLGGGLLCAIAQIGLYCLTEFADMTQKDASAIILIAVIFLTALVTGLGVYDKAAQKLGAGLAVPITGFANSVAASMMEHRSEGFVLGSGCNSFKLAGAVVVFGFVSAFFAGLIVWITTLF